MFQSSKGLGWKVVCLTVVFVVSGRRASPTGSQNSQVDWNVVRSVSGGWVINMQLRGVA